MMYITYHPFLKSLMITWEPVNVNIGNNANGNCNDISTFNKSFIVVTSSMPRNTDINIVGIIAMERVNNSRFHLDQCRFKNP